VVVALVGCGLLAYMTGMFGGQSSGPELVQATAENGSASGSASLPGLEPAEATATAEAAQGAAAEPEQAPTQAPAEPTPTRTPRPTKTPRPTQTPTPPGPASRVLTFGEEGIGPGQFTDARSIAVDSRSGNIFVGEYIGGRVQVFDSEGEFISLWSVDPEMPLRGLDVNRAGNAYVVQSGLLYTYNNETGEQLDERGYQDTWGFDDVVVGADGGLVTAWFGRSKDDIVRFNSYGEPVLTIEAAISGQSGDSELDMRVAVDGLNNIYALGTFNEAVFKFGPDGKFIDQFGASGDGPGMLDSPMAIAVDGQGRVYVSELVGPIKIYDSGGQYLDSIDVQAFGMRFDDDDNLYVASRTRVLKYEIDLP
jgi:DNA-binding beta-propeller fold protein YncE